MADHCEVCGMSKKARSKWTKAEYEENFSRLHAMLQSFQDSREVELEKEYQRGYDACEAERDEEMSREDFEEGRRQGEHEGMEYLAEKVVDNLHTILEDHQIDDDTIQEIKNRLKRSF